MGNYLILLSTSGSSGCYGLLILILVAVIAVAIGVGINCSRRSRANKINSDELSNAFSNVNNNQKDGKDQLKIEHDKETILNKLPELGSRIVNKNDIPKYKIHMLAEMLDNGLVVTKEVENVIYSSIFYYNLEIVCTTKDELEFATSVFKEWEMFPIDNAEKCFYYILSFHGNPVITRYYLDKVKKMAHEGSTDYQACTMKLWPSSKNNLPDYPYESFESIVVEKVKKGDPEAISSYAKFCNLSREELPMEERVNMFNRSLKLDPRPLTAHRLIEEKYVILFDQCNSKIPKDVEDQFYKDMLPIADEGLAGRSDSYKGEMAYKIGDMFFDGNHFDKDNAMAYKYYCISRDSGYTEAEHKIELIKDGV